MNDNDKEIIDKVSMLTGIRQEKISKVLEPLSKIQKMTANNLKEVVELIDSVEGINDKDNLALLSSYFVFQIEILESPLKEIIINCINEGIDKDKLKEFMNDVNKL